MPRTALVVVDMQIGLFEGEPRYDADGVVERINALAGAVRAAGGIVVFIQHEDDGAYVHGTPGWKLLPSLDSGPKDFCVGKTACDSFYRSDLEKVLREHEITRLLVTGCATDFCVDTTLRSAASKDYDVVAVADGHTTKDRPYLDAKTIITHHNAMWAGLILPGRPVTVLPTSKLLETV